MCYNYTFPVEAAMQEFYFVDFQYLAELPDDETVSISIKYPQPSNYVRKCVYARLSSLS